MKAEEHIYPYALSDFSRHDVLVLAPHPDDESIGCGGSIFKHTRAGSRVKIIFLTNGDQGDFEGRFGKDYLAIRLQSAEKALNILQVKEHEFWGYKDRDLSSKTNEVIERLSSVIKSFSPSVIYAPSPFDIHPDHRTTFIIAWKIAQKLTLKLLLFETLVPLYPNILVDITQEWQSKKRAIESYWTELYYTNYTEKVEGLNRYRTATLSRDVLYAEAFLLADPDKTEDNTLQQKLLQAAVKFHLK